MRDGWTFALLADEGFQFGRFQYRNGRVVHGQIHIGIGEDDERLQGDGGIFREDGIQCFLGVVSILTRFQRGVAETLDRKSVV